MPIRRTLAIALTTLASQACALAQDTVDLRYGPVESDGDAKATPEVIETSVQVTSTVSNLPGAPAASSQFERRLLWVAPDVVSAKPGAEVVYSLVVHRLAIELVRPGWDRDDYYSWLPKRNPSAAMRRLDGHIFNKPQLFMSFNAASGVVREPGAGYNTLNTSIGRMMINPNVPRDQLDTIRDEILQQSIIDSLDMGISFIAGEDVQVGDSWTRSRTLLIPFTNPATINWTCTLESIDDQVAVILLDPEVEIDNPGGQPQGISVMLKKGSAGNGQLLYDVRNEQLVRLERRLDLPFRVTRPTAVGDETFDFDITIEVEAEPRLEIELEQRR